MKQLKISCVLLCAVLASCSGEDSSSGDHVWKEQTDTIDRAKDAEKKMMDAVQLQKQAIEEQTQ